MNRERDEEISTLYEANYHSLMQLAYRETGSMEDAEDLVQSVFLIALCEYERLVNAKFKRGWLIQTLNYQIKNYRRRNTYRATEPLTDANAKTAEGYHKLNELLPAELSDQDKELLIWRFEQQMEYTEMAMRLGISVNACRVRVCRAITQFRAIQKIF